MRFQPNRNYDSNDVVQTPVDLARRLVSHFKPKGRILEPCKGEGNIFRFLPPGSEWCEITEGRDFLLWKEKIDWIITNPPWSKIRPFLAHAMSVSDNVVFLLTINHIWTKARIRDIQTAGFGIKEIVLVEMPESFPQSGFQLGAVHVARAWNGQIALSDISVQARAKRPAKNALEASLPTTVSIFERVSGDSLSVAGI